MTSKAVQTAWLDKQAARISALAEQAEDAARQGLEQYREIGQVLLDVKETMLGTGQGAFGKWCEDNVPFKKDWRSKLMRLAERWEEIEPKSIVHKTFSVDQAVALLRPPPGPFVEATEANKLSGLAAHASRADGSQEARTAQRKLEEIASQRGTSAEELAKAAVRKANSLANSKSMDKRELSQALAEIERLRAILDKHNIPY